MKRPYTTRGDAANKRKPPALAEHHKINFQTLYSAGINGDLALISATEKGTNKPVAILVALQHNADGTISPVPLATMIDGHPYERFNDPTE